MVGPMCDNRLAAQLALHSVRVACNSTPYAGHTFRHPVSDTRKTTDFSVSWTLLHAQPAHCAAEPVVVRQSLHGACEFAKDCE